MMKKRVGFTFALLYTPLCTFAYVRIFYYFSGLRVRVWSRTSCLETITFLPFSFPFILHFVYKLIYCRFCTQVTGVLP
jgi:hypothetical protein